MSAVYDTYSYPIRFIHNVEKLYIEPDYTKYYTTDSRYYGGNEFIDMAERLCQQRALSLYKVDAKDWGVNVQALSGRRKRIYLPHYTCF